MVMRYALRPLWKAWTFSLVAIATLVIGAGAAAVALRTD